ncbi:MAG: bifunctional UDP-N-acetylglucosamine pyrophosphorylase/glucosamine-1-phosphate N-acetyltransferase [Paracoccaceae bacterium]|jgi:bifunctional UDP-N-acetylglucosamine pyrophosphorylase/glucosamine-1-phosphate N-acetyltransferase
MATALIVLAAGKGTRMNSDIPKVLHRLAGVPMLAHAMRAGICIEAEKTVIVAGHGVDAVSEAAKLQDPDAVIVVQEEQRGTGHAVGCAKDALGDFDGDIIVLYGDTPFVTPETLKAMLKARTEGHGVVVLGFEAADPTTYGRFVVGSNNQLDAIIEAKEATAEQRKITLCNSGVVCADAKQLFELVDRITDDNTSGEFYLTDIVALANQAGLTAGYVTCPEAETLGINSRSQLALAEAAFQARARTEATENGVTLAAPDSVYFAFDTMIGRDVLIGPNVVFGPGVTIESGAEIKAFSHLEGCHISEGASVGPFARLRAGAEIGADAKVGNFVEIKEANIGKGAKVNHLSYIGDAEIGEAANIGAGTITCNYDGVLKHKTVIGAGAFIGSNTALVAPVSIGAEAMTGSGSVITSDVEDGALAIARAVQVNKPGLAKRLRSKLLAIKAKKNKG